MYQYNITVPANKLSDANVMAIIRSVRFSLSVYSERIVIVIGTTVPLEKVVDEKFGDEPLEVTVYGSGSSILCYIFG
jgi:hypothetical protein